MTKEMFEEITAWQKANFTKATKYSALNHLKEEIKELEQDLLHNNSSAVNEYADCFMLLFGSAFLYGLSYEDICSVINEKMKINKERKWGSVNEQGYVKHVE